MLTKARCKRTHFKQLSRELERRRLEVDAARGVRQHEAEVDVDKVPVVVKQQVAVVTILQLQAKPVCVELVRCTLRTHAVRTAAHA